MPRYPTNPHLPVLLIRLRPDDGTVVHVSTDGHLVRLHLHNPAIAETGSHHVDLDPVGADHLAAVLTARHHRRPVRLFALIHALWRIQRP